MGSQPNSTPGAAEAASPATVSPSASGPSLTSTPSPCGKRSRDPEDEVYLDNFHHHKRYLSEMMASSLNGLTVGDTLPDHLMESPARSESMFYHRDDLSLQYSPMSEDSEDSRYCEGPTSICSAQPDSRPTSPVSPFRYQRPVSMFSNTPSTSTHPLHSNTVASVACSQHRQRGSDSEGRFPSSPSDICHSADLRRAALLRSVQMRAQPPGQSTAELSFPSGQEAVGNVDAEERSCSYVKSLIDEREYRMEVCSSTSILEPEFNQEKSGRLSDMNLSMKDANPGK